MIPEELHLRNFLSHRETDLDLRGVHVASLVGDNGAGKSALLDAMTWVVWGQSRAPFGREDDLIFHGETGLEVEFVFLMPFQGGTERRYRILRRREIRGRRNLSSQLDFQVEGENGWNILTAGSIRETQARIVEHLGLEYDTFINSAYLRQGHADEFTVQTPAQRKRVLSAILGLDRWALYQERAKNILAAYQGELKALNARLDEIEAELSHREEYETALNLIASEVATAEAQLHAAQEAVDELTRAQEQAAGLQRQLVDAEKRMQQESDHLAALQAEVAERQERHSYFTALLAQAPEIEKRYQDYQHLIQQERAFADKLNQIARLQMKQTQLQNQLADVREALNRKLRDSENRINTHERAIQAERARLEQELGECRSQISLLNERLPDEDAQKALDKAKERLSALAAFQQELDAVTTRLRENEVEYSRLTELNRQYRTQMAEDKSRIEALTQHTADCPLCGQPLTEEHRARLLEESESEGQQLGDLYRSNAAKLTELSEEQTLYRDRMHKLEVELRVRPAQEQLVARLQQQMEQGEQARMRIADLQQQAQDLEKGLTGENFAETEREALHAAVQEQKQIQLQLDGQDDAPDVREALRGVRAEIEAAGYDAEEHELLKLKLHEQQVVEEHYRELETARESSHREQEMLERLAGDMDRQQERITLLEEGYQQHRCALDKLQPLLSTRAELMRRLTGARDLSVTTRQALGAMKQNLAALETLEKRALSLRANKLEIVHQTGLYTELREACGVNGIPAMIIEHTLPELESEANRLLQQLTGGRMHVRFDTQRETKTGNLRETLDIIISDEKGTRPYENFSGGEQFRVNFAIRVALSRLLARRSGVRLRSLFVDEGFGALDADGRQRLVEAVKTVQDSFQLILVITHIDELRDAFQTQIRVEKTDGGSIVEVV